jgi:hypothetical protein
MLLIHNGRLDFIKDDTKWPKGPWPSQIPNKCYHVFPLRFGFVM